MLSDTVLELSNELVELQRPIRILDSIKWDDSIERGFFAAGATRQPAVDHRYYVEDRPLGFETEDLKRSLRALRAKTSRLLGEQVVSWLIGRRIDEYLRVLDLLEARGTPAFAEISAELYGCTTDRLHRNGPTLGYLGEVMAEALANIASGSWEPPEPKVHSAAAGVEILERNLRGVFNDPDNSVRVILDDGIVADAAAGGDYIKLREDATFSERDLRVLEVHEGWVHVATTLNGRAQPHCTFLGIGTPLCTATQEGLAVFTEITTLSSTPDRLRKVTRRMTAIEMVENGATFLDVYRWYLGEGVDEQAAWSSSVRVFRGSTPTGGPFTKDLVYSRGFLEVYDFMRLAVRHGLIDRLPLLFAGKLSVHELGAIAQLVAEGLVVEPQYVPPHIRDVSALASWMAYSNLLNRIDLGYMEEHLAAALSSGG